MLFSLYFGALFWGAHTFINVVSSWCIDFYHYAMSLSLVHICLKIYQNVLLKLVSFIGRRRISIRLVKMHIQSESLSMCVSLHPHHSWAHNHLRPQLSTKAFTVSLVASSFARHQFVSLWRCMLWTLPSFDTFSLLAFTISLSPGLRPPPCLLCFVFLPSSPASSAP